MIGKKCNYCSSIFKVYPSTLHIKSCSISCSKKIQWKEGKYNNRKCNFSKGMIPWNKGKKYLVLNHSNKFLNKINPRHIVPHTKETKEKISIVIKKQYENGREVHNKGKFLTLKTKEKISVAKKRFYKTKKGMEVKKRISFSNKGKKQSEKSNLKRRLAQIRHVEQQKLNGFPLMPCIGKHETHILDSLERLIGYKIIRQYKIVGYFLDGYCPMLKLAVEIDEKHHKKQVEKDLIRQKEIENVLECNFFRIDVGGYSG